MPGRARTPSWDKLFSTASGQEGLFTTEQAAAAGITTSSGRRTWFQRACRSRRRPGCSRTPRWPRRTLSPGRTCRTSPRRARVSRPAARRRRRRRALGPRDVGLEPGDVILERTDERSTPSGRSRQPCAGSRAANDDLLGSRRTPSGSSRTISTRVRELPRRAERVNGGRRDPQAGGSLLRAQEPRCLHAQ